MSCSLMDRRGVRCCVRGVEIILMCGAAQLLSAQYLHCQICAFGGLLSGIQGTSLLQHDVILLLQVRSLQFCCRPLPDSVGHSFVVRALVMLCNFEFSSNIFSSKDYSCTAT